MLNRALLADMIGDAYRIIEAEDGKQAVAALQKEGAGISLVLLDYVMPQMNGFDVLEVMNKNGWIKDIPVIMVSAESDAAYIERAYELGVTDFINRPYDVNIVRRRVMNTLMLYQKQRTLMGMVADQVYEREKSNNLMVYILSHIVEFRNGESGMHVLNVQAMTEMILTQLTRLTDQYPLTTEDISLITMASSLHDIGKIAIPEEILNKPGRFTDEEFAIMKTHSAVGSDMLDDLELYKDEKLVKVARDICRWHHERWDGRGVPRWPCGRRHSHIGPGSCPGRCVRRPYESPRLQAAVQPRRGPAHDSRRGVRRVQSAYSGMPDGGGGRFGEAPEPRHHGPRDFD